jgi:DUF4097 and DUF4098 domain-containing protein YvlB
MRRGSLVGPLLLIAIGGWLLMSILRPDLRMFDVAAMYWPWLLVGWGALRVIEILVWMLRGRPLPQAGISGGEWAIIVLLCFAGSGLYTVNRWSNGHYGFIQANRVEIFGRGFDFPITEKKVAAPAQCRVLIENLRGGARVTGADVQEVIVGGRKSIRALREGDAEAADRQSEIEVVEQGGLVTIRTNIDRVTGDQKVNADLELTVPRAASVEFRGRDGEIEMLDLNGGVEVVSDKAEVRLRNIGGNARLDVRDARLVRANDLKGKLEIQGGRGGDIELDTIAGEVTIDGAFSGDLQFRNLAKPIRIQGPSTELRVERIPGEIRMDLDKFSATNLVGPIRLTSSRSRDVQLEQFTNSLELSVRGGDITLRPAGSPLPKIGAKTRDGNVVLVLPADAKFALKAVSSRGDVSNDYGPALKTVNNVEDRHGAASIVSAAGQGPEITVETDRGSITVRKDSGAALTPQPGRAPETDKASIEVEKN